MRRLKRLKIHQYRTVRPGVELRFHDGVNVLVGLNGSGKTTLLELIGMILRDDLRSLANEPFSIEYEWVLEGRHFIVTVSNTPADKREGARAAGDGSDRDQLVPSARVQFGLDAVGELLLGENQSTLVSPNATIDVLEAAGWHGGASTAQPLCPFLEILNVAYYHFAFATPHEIEPFLALAWSRQIRWTAGRLDEALEWWKTVVSSSIVVQGPGRRASAHEAGLLRPFAEATSASIAAGASLLTCSSADVPALRRAVELLGYREARVHIEQTGATPRSQGSRTYGNPRLYFTLQNGAVLPFEQLSFGERRFVAFLYYTALLNEHDAVVVDELTNGMHHRMVETCLEQVEGRQCFFATQSPLLLDHLEFSSAEEVERAFVIATRESDAEGDWMKWSHMEPSEAEDFYQDYVVGIQHVNDILRVRGLW